MAMLGLKGFMSLINQAMQCSSERSGLEYVLLIQFIDMDYLLRDPVYIRF